MERFPTITTLANASERDVLNLWEGLGYYSRARNLHKAALMISQESNGSIPRDIVALQHLPGIGKYTAAAIASIAYDQDVAAVDGNVKRVYSRIFDIRQPINIPDGENCVRALAEENLPTGQSADYNQALMDLGATICKRRSPECHQCPLHSICRAYELGIQEERPIMKAKPKQTYYNVTAAVIYLDGKFLITKRPLGGLLAGLWEFPGGRQEKGETLPECLRREIQEELGAECEVGDLIGMYKHAYTHIRFTLYAYLCTLLGEPKPIEADGIQWVSKAELENYPMGKVDRLIARKISREEQC
jgi:A/G-specific adenine glycosylase